MKTRFTRDVSVAALAAVLTLAADAVLAVPQSPAGPAAGPGRLAADVTAVPQYHSNAPSPFGIDHDYASRPAYGAGYYDEEGPNWSWSYSPAIAPGCGANVPRC